MRGFGVVVITFCLWLGVLGAMVVFGSNLVKLDLVLLGNIKLGGMLSPKEFLETQHLIPGSHKSLTFKIASQ